MTSLPYTSSPNLPIDQYQTLLAEKQKHLQNLLSPFVTIEDMANMSVYSSVTHNFRMRAEFGIWHEGNDCFYTMVEKDAEGNQQKVKVDEFAIASTAINKLMPELIRAIKSDELLKKKLFQVEFLNTLSGEMLVTLIYHKKLEDEWQALALELEKTLGCYIIGRSRKQKMVLSQDFVVEALQILDKTYRYKQLEGGFTQPNAEVCQHMLTWACNQAKVIAESDRSGSNDLLELYCGNANFTLPLSQYFTKVLATEISKTSVAAAQWNISENHIDNIAIARLSAEEFTQAKNGVKEFRRLQQAGIELSDYEFSTIFVDPPRAGIDDDTLELMAEFDNIIYISCNPDTLADNLKSLCKTHEVINTALFDQFPYTHHIEAGVCLRRIEPSTVC